MDAHPVGACVDAVVLFPFQCEEYSKGFISIDFESTGKIVSLETWLVGKCPCCGWISSPD